jgi:hypothetical protein
MRRKQLKVRVTPEFLRSRARRDASCVGQCGWRPTKSDLANLRTSKQDAIAYRTMVRAWRSAGFKIAAISKLAGRKPHRRISPPTPARTSTAAISINEEIANEHRSNDDPHRRLG